jgi:hypothetical protein
MVALGRAESNPPALLGDTLGARLLQTTAGVLSAPAPGRNQVPTPAVGAEYKGLEPSMFIFFRVGRDSLDAMHWDERVAREVEHQARIETAFDRADAFERLGDVERALVWTDRAHALIAGDR